VWQSEFVPAPSDEDAQRRAPGGLRTLEVHAPIDEDVIVARRRVATFGVRPDDPTVMDSVRDFARRYGWRAYALPVLVVITVAALLSAGTPKTGNHDATSRRGGGAAAPPPASGNIALKSDQPASGSLDTVLSAAALPPGPAYTKQGKGTYQVLKGSSRVIGKGTLHRYSVEVEKGIAGVDLAQFASLVQTVLSDRRSWSGHGVSMQRVDSGRTDLHVALVSSMTVRTLCGYDIPIETSCFVPTDPATGATINRVVINDARWMRGDAAYVGDLNAYRVYMINHEDGHALGHEHAHQCLPGGLAPVMMQQTIGLKSAVTGQMCAANPWPFPLGVTGTPGAEQPDTAQNSEFRLKND
jgi:hypothetical protein